MRKCKVTHYATPDRQVKVEIGKFHCWGNEYEEFENGIGNATMAFVELDDGRMVTVNSNSIEFLPDEPTSTPMIELSNDDFRALANAWGQLYWGRETCVPEHLRDLNSRISKMIDTVRAKESIQGE